MKRLSGEYQKKSFIINVIPISVSRAKHVGLVSRPDQKGHPHGQA